MLKKLSSLFIIILFVLLVDTYALEDASLELNMDVYEGLIDYMEITLTAPELNKDIRVGEQAIAKITTTDSSIGINVVLVETGKNTGVFSEKIRFSFDHSNSAENTIKVRAGTKLYVQSYDLTAEATWMPYNAKIEFDADTYSGLGACPKITLIDMDLDTMRNAAEEVEIRVISKSDNVGVPVILHESAPNSGEFTGYVKLTNDISNQKERNLHVGYNDDIIALYLDTNNTSTRDVLCTDSAIWKPQSATIKLSSSSFSGLNSKCKITVNDSDMDLRHEEKDMLIVKVTSDIDPAGICVKLYETKEDTGIFTNDILFSRYSSNEGWQTLKVGPQSNINATYCDDWNDTGKRYTYIQATAKFQFVQGVISTSAGTQSILSGSTKVTVRDPDADTNNQKNTIPVKIISDSCREGLILWLEETGTSTGSFSQTLYFSKKPVYDNKKKDLTIKVAQGDNVEIAYNDETNPKGGSFTATKKYTWSHQKAEIKLDKNSYVGYNSSANITVTDYEANKDPRHQDIVKIKVSTPSVPEFNIYINETRADSGQFRGILYFGKQGSPSRKVLKTESGDKIKVEYADQGEYSFGTVETSAIWKPHDAELNLNNSTYYGNNAEVSITVKDFDAATKTNKKDIIYVSVEVVGKSGPIKFPLEETGLNTSIYTGKLMINNPRSRLININLFDGEQLQVKYTDKDTTKNKQIELKASAVWKSR